RRPGASRAGSRAAGGRAPRPRPVRPGWPGGEAGCPARAYGRSSRRLPEREDRSRDAAHASDGYRTKVAAVPAAVVARAGEPDVAGLHHVTAEGNVRQRSSRAVAVGDELADRQDGSRGRAGLVEVDHVARDGDHALENGLRAAGTRAGPEIAADDPER